MGEHYFIYKTTCKINGKFYIGQHKTNNLDDGYLGSGFGLRRAIRKYGKDAFIREILIECNSREELNLHEIAIVNEAMIANPLCYNIALGGRAGRSSTLSKDHKAKIKASFTDARRALISKQVKERWAADPSYQLRLEAHNKRSVSKETRTKMSLTRRDKPQSAEHKLNRANAIRGKKRSTEFCEKMREINRGRAKTPETLAKIMQERTCPHCGVTGKPMNMGRWHFDKCKSRKF